MDTSFASRLGTSELPYFPLTCPLFDPEPFRDREFEWNDEPFIRQRVAAELGVPIGTCSAVQRLQAAIDAAGARAIEPLVLAVPRSVDACDVYLRVASDVPGLPMAKLSGTFLTRDYTGAHSELPMWIEDMRNFIEARSKRLETLYLAFTNCRMCAAHYGANHVVLFGKVMPK